MEHVHRRHTISHTKSGQSENECQLDATNTPFLELDEVTVKLNCDDPHLGIEIKECSARRRGYIYDAKKGSSFAKVRGWSRKYRGAYVVQVDNNWTVTPHDVAEQLEIARDKAKAEGRNSIKLILSPERDDLVMDKSGAPRLYEGQMIARLQEQLAEAQEEVVRLETKAEKQDKAIKFLFKDNEQLKRKLEESSSRSQGKALRDLCDRNDRLEAENRQLRERFAALADLANGGSEHMPNNAASAASRRRNSNPVEHTAFYRRNSNQSESHQPPIAALPRPASSRRRHSMYGSVREIPTGMLQAPPPEHDPDQHKERDFRCRGHSHGEEDDPILGKTFSVNTGPSPLTTVPEKRVMRRRATMFT